MCRSFRSSISHDMYDKTAALWLERLRDKTFAVRCKRSGSHDFSSLDVERYIGGLLNQNSSARGVDVAQSR